MTAFLTRLTASERGTSVVEMALLAPVFALLTLGTVDTARGVAEKLKLQQAAARTIEKATAGGINGDSFDSLRPEAASAAGVEQSAVTVDNWLECDGVRQDSFTGTCTSTQEVGRFASVTIVKGYTPWFASSLSGLGYNVSRAITMQGKASVRLQ